VAFWDPVETIWAKIIVLQFVPGETLVCLGYTSFFHKVFVILCVIIL